MGRRATIWQRDEDGFFYTTFRGKQVKLSQDAKEADKAFHTLHAHAPDEGENVGYRPTFRKVADLYLTFTEQSKSHLTYTHQKYFLQLFCDQVRTRRAADVKPGDLNSWCLKNKDHWGHNTQVTAKGIVVACFNWSVEQGYLPFSPLGLMKLGQMHRGGRVLTLDERDRILAAVTNKTFRRFLIFLGLTGCRPYSEASQINADMIDWDESSITFAKHKNARKGKTRVVYLCEEAKALLRQMIAECPEGPLFVTRYHIPYNKGNVIKAVRRLEKKLDMPRWNFYSLRKSYITEALEKGLSSDIVAALCGNSVKTIERHYNFLESKKNTLRAAAERVVS